MRNCLGGGLTISTDLHYKRKTLERVFGLGGEGHTVFESNAIAPTTSFSGNVANFNVTSVITPKVPSLPQNNLVKSYPVLDFLARLLVFKTWPVGNTTVKFNTQSFMVP